jgi:3-hydroxyisobutyrate dehydrogenase-like beta-hydroxyacid dehydrogenase
MAKRVGIVGIGIMGTAMMRNLCRNRLTGMPIAVAKPAIGPWLSQALCATTFRRQPRGSDRLGRNRFS